jgi:hypothetical protein
MRALEHDRMRQLTCQICRRGLLEPFETLVVVSRVEWEETSKMGGNRCGVINYSRDHAVYMHKAPPSGVFMFRPGLSEPTSPW